MKTVVWMREDLRTYDNPALHYAALRGDIVPVFIYPLGLGAASHWWLHHSLASLAKSFSEQGVELILRRGDPVLILPEIANAIGIDSVVWNRVYSPRGMASGQSVKQALESASIGCRSFNGQLLIEPSHILNKQGTPFKVFTPFWRHCLTVLNPQAPLETPNMTPCSEQIDSEDLHSWGLLPTNPNWAKGIAERWQPGEQGAQLRLETFLADSIDRYKDGRDNPSQENTSMLSPHLTFGEVSPHSIWFAVQEAIATASIGAENGNKFLSEIGWREFSRYLLVHFPEIVDKPFNRRFLDFPWQSDDELLSAWKDGKTGYPIVDAGMRELWHTGYMHNRVRMIVASFLTKHLLTHWQAGMQWFWDTLVDADIANNTASWQWAAGCGADAAPYFRIFNPILQGDKFDSQGEYIRRWVPELGELPNRYINKPWEADAVTLQLANVRLGESYPYPIVDHKEARESALAAYQVIKAAQQE